MRALLIGLALGAASLPAAEQTVYQSAEVGFRWLNVPTSARVAALADAFVARSAEPGGMEDNPAALAGLKSWQADFTHNAWVQGMAVEQLQVADPVGCWGTAALQLDYLNLGQVDRYTLDNSGQPVAQGTFNANSYAVTAAWAGDWGPLSLGAALRTLGQQLDGSDTHAFQGDLGLRYAFAGGWRAGLAVRNLSLDGSTGLQPLSFRGGAGYTFGIERPLALDAAVDDQTQDGESPTWRVAAEWAVQRSFIVRAGWVMADQRQPNGPTAGVGLLTPWCEVDYAFYGAGDLGYSQLVTLHLTGWGAL